MAFLHIDSCECTKSELDLFSIPPTQIAIERGEWVEYKPISALNDTSQIEFTVPGIGEEYMDLSHTLLYLKVKVVKADGTPLTENDVVAPVNNWMHSLFSQVDIYLNQRQISTPTGNYAYRAYIENILNYNSDSKNTHLKNVMFYADVAGKMNEHVQNDGFKKRQSLTAGSKAVEMVGHLHSDLFNHERALLNGVELRLRLIVSRASFSLMTSTNNEYKVQFLDAALGIRKMKLNPSILIAHSKTLDKCTAKYPITRVDVKTTTLAAGLRSYTIDNLINGQLPKRVILGLVNNKAVNGDFKTNPFNFHHFNLNYLCLYIDGHQVPSKALQPDFNNALYAEAYTTLFKGTGIHYSNHTHNISLEEYVGGYTLYCYDLTHDLSAHLPTHWSLIRHGSVRVDAGFSAALEDPVNMILYAEYDNIIEIDKRRNVSIDYVCVSALKLTELRIDKHTVRGNTTLLECKFDLEGETLYAVKWYKDGNEFFRYLPKDSPQIQVFDVAGVHVDVKNSGASQVYLKSLELSSSGRYRCEVSGEAPSFTTVTEHNDMVTVALPDEGPKINGGKPRYHIGDTVDVNCTSGRSKPAASLHWFINGEQVNSSFLRGPYKNYMGREGLETTVLGLKFKVQAEHFRNGDMKLKCLATIATVYWRSNEESVEGEKQHKPPVMEIKKTEELEDDKSRADRVQASSGCRSKCNWHVLNYIPLLSFHALIVPIIAVR